MIHGHAFKLSFEFEQLKIEKYVSLLYAIRTTNIASKSFPLNTAFSNSTFLYLQIKSREFRKVYKPLYFIFVSNNYKYSNYRIIEILIECSNFFLSLAYLYIEFSLSLSLSLNSIKWKNVFSLLYLSKHSILLLSNESFLYIRIISRETCKQVNVTSSQGNDISIVKSRVPFPKQN